MSLRTKLEGPLIMNTRFQKIAVAAALVSGVAFGLPAMAQGSTSPSDSDTAVAQQVKAALSQVRVLRDADDDIAVAVNNGVVKLSGWVTYADDIRTAEQTALAVPGVKDVDASFRVWSSNSRPGL
jgi:osmotically-inducible protein OsmY